MLDAAYCEKMVLKRKNKLKTRAHAVKTVKKPCSFSENSKIRRATDVS